MSDQPFACLADRRRDQVRARGRNGIDYIEVAIDPPALTVYFLDKAPANLQKANIRISGGRRVRNLQVEDLHLCIQEDEERDDCLKIILKNPGDFSTYRLCFVEVDAQGRPTGAPFAGFDPKYACLSFSFAASCPSDLDCQAAADCAPITRAEPEISYLAKDYASFRQLILDRLALLMPGWQERHVPDLGITLVELLAYVGDHLSYFQDAVATEAYLDSARQRISVRRHARLVDYALHEGCNARTWVCVQVESEHHALDPQNIYFVTNHHNILKLGTPVLSHAEIQQLAADHYDVFEPLTCAPIQLFAAHNELHFYTWGDTECCLAAGSTRATLYYDWQPLPPAAPPEVDGETVQSPAAKTGSGKAGKAAVTAPPENRQHLQPGDVLIFEEVIGPQTGNRADADPRHRHAVRITGREYLLDDLYEPPVQLVEITWGPEDALPFPLCISAIIPPDCRRVENISVARGNAILVDHGRSWHEDLPPAPAPPSSPPTCEGEGQPQEQTPAPVRYYPTLTRGPLTHSVPLPVDQPAEPTHWHSAQALWRQDVRAALPVIRLSELTAETSQPMAGFARAHAFCPAGDQTSGDWQPRYDLLSSSGEDRHVVAEIDNFGLAHLRFGDGELGNAPPAGIQLRAHYRVGNGLAGNVGAEAVAHLVYRQHMVAGVRSVRNPLPAQGGADPEPLREAKLFAPHAFRQELRRAVAAADYARLAERNPNVQRAAAALYWTGSWYAMQVTVDPLGGAEVAPDLLQALSGYLHPYRRIGHDVVVEPARYAPLELRLTVCVKPNYLRGQVKATLLDRLSNRNLPDGTRGFFHSDNLTFGAGIYVSALVALVQAVAGVESVQVTTLKRMYELSSTEAQQVLDDGVLQLGPREIPQLDNDPSQPENGKLILTLSGGR